MSVAGKVLIWRAIHAARRAQRERRLQLERELAAYSTDSDRNEIDAILDRYPEGQTGELRSILAQQRCAQVRNRGIPGLGAQQRC